MFYIGISAYYHESSVFLTDNNGTNCFLKDQVLYEDERFTDLVMEKAAEFVISEMPLVDEDHQFDLALMVMETVNVSSF